MSGAGSNVALRKCVCSSRNAAASQGRQRLSSCRVHRQACSVPDHSPLTSQLCSPHAHREHCPLAPVLHHHHHTFVCMHWAAGCRFFVTCPHRCTFTSSLRGPSIVVPEVTLLEGTGSAGSPAIYKFAALVLEVGLYRAEVLLDFFGDTAEIVSAAVHGESRVPGEGEGVIATRVQMLPEIAPTDAPLAFMAIFAACFFVPWQVNGEQCERQFHHTPVDGAPFRLTVTCAVGNDATACSSVVPPVLCFAPFVAVDASTHDSLLPREPRERAHAVALWSQRGRWVSRQTCIDATPPCNVSFGGLVPTVSAHRFVDTGDVPQDAVDAWPFTWIPYGCHYRVFDGATAAAELRQADTKIYIVGNSLLSTSPPVALRRPMRLQQHARRTWLSEGGLAHPALRVAMVGTVG